jgi:hypothetical protein
MLQYSHVRALRERDQELDRMAIPQGCRESSEILI